MAHAFAPIPAKPSFGNLRENLYQSDYISRKKAKYTYCQTPSYCNKIKIANSYEQVNSFNLGRYSQSLETCNILPINKSNLIVSQYSKLNLNGVCTVSYGAPPSVPCSIVNPCSPCQNNTPVIINPTTSTTPFYFNATIDPNGELFGASQCGELNYTKYMVFDPPSPPLTLGFS
jgi:hypothetical protein